MARQAPLHDGRGRETPAGPPDHQRVTLDDNLVAVRDWD